MTDAMLREWAIGRRSMSQAYGRARMYEHIEKSERESGRSLERSKQIAAATVVKHHNDEQHSSGR
jgi:hypothetical protein